VKISERDVLAYVRRLGEKPVRVHDVARALHVPRGELPALRQMLRRLRDQDKLPRQRSATRQRPEPQAGAGQVIGRVHGTRRNVAFILQESGPDFRVRGENLRDAVHGDIVRVRLRRERGRLEGVVEEVLERGRRCVSGTLEHSGAGWFLVPDDARIGRDLNLSRSRVQPAPAQRGHKALARIVGFEPRGDLIGDIEAILGPADHPGVRTRALLAEFDLPEQFPAEVQRQVEGLRPPQSGDLDGRDDFSAWLAFTIDPHDAKDHDDAVSIRRLPSGGFEIGVHIADVAHYVTPGSAVDVEAERRATSVYLSDRVVPMLPELLSNHVCSLRPGVPRLTQSAILQFDAHGETVQTRLARSWIVSRAKLSYHAADALLRGEPAPPGHTATGIEDPSGETPAAQAVAWDALVPELVAALADMRHVARLLKARRIAAGGLEIETPEYRVVHDARGRVLDVKLRDALESYGIIEELMLAANVTVARQLAKARLPLLWRAHPEPEFQASEELRLFLRKLGMHWTPAEPPTNRDYQNVINAIARRPERRYLMYKVLRSLQKARYEPRHGGHFGLAFSHYTHFTSPIRRYPDLYNHRLVRGQILDAETFQRRGKDLRQLATHTSACEVRAADAERASLKLKLCELLQDRIGSQTTGFVSSISEYGLYVDLPEWSAEGLLQLRDDDYTPDLQRTRLTGGRSGRTFRFGQELRVALVRVDPDRRQIDLGLAT
jgi:ribonuclease R